MNDREAIRESVRSRIRPIFMSTTTSVLGMLPLVIFPGAGSELYRGIGSVVIGGLAVSTLFTLILVPALFSLVRAMHATLRLRFGKRPNAPIAALALCVFMIPAEPRAQTESDFNPTNGTFVLSLDRCMELALGGNIQLQIESRLPLIRGEDYFIAEETFTPAFLGSVEMLDRELRTVNTQVGADVLKEEITTTDARVAKRWPPGTRTDLIWAYERRADNSEFRTVNPAHRNSLIFELTQPLLKGFGGAINRLDIERAVRGRNAADKEYEIRIETELLNTYQRYWQLVRASAAVTHREFAYAAAMSDFELVTQQVATGARSEVDQLAASAELASASERLAQANATYARASSDLLLQIRPMSEIPQNFRIIPSSQLQQTNVVEREPDLPSSIESALRDRPEMGLYELQMELRGFELLEARDNRKPRLDVQAAVGPNGLGADFSESVNDLTAFNKEWRVGLTLAFLFDSESRKARWRQAIWNEETAALRIQLARATIAADVNASIIDIQEANSMLSAASQGMLATERAHSLARDRREVGMATAREVLQSEREIAAATFRLTLAQTQQLLAKAQYEAAIGRFSKWVMAAPGE